MTIIDLIVQGGISFKVINTKLPRTLSDIEKQHKRRVNFLYADEMKKRRSRSPSGEKPKSLSER